MSRFGCNAGGCHGKQSGQNGFKLSLFGFDTDFDYHALVTEARGRRVMVTAPEKSLLLLKGTALFLTVAVAVSGQRPKLPFD